MATQTTPAGAAAAAQNGNAVTSPANAQQAMGLMAKLNAQVTEASKEVYDDAFDLQKQVTEGGYTSEKAKDYWEMECNTSELKIHAFMVPGSPFLRVGYGPGKFTGGDAALGATPQMFVGQITEFNPLPSSLILPPSFHAWQSVSANYDVTSFLQHYDVGGTNMDTYRSGGGTSKKLPKLIHIPFEAAKVLLENNKCTPEDLVRELVRLEGDTTSKITEEHTLLIKQWCIGARTKGAGAGKNSKLAISMTPITTQDPLYDKSRMEKLNSLLGERTVPAATAQPPPAAAPSPSTATTPAPSTADQMLKMMEMSVRATEASVKAMEALANNTNSNQGQQQQQPTQPVNQLNDIKYPEGSFLAALMGWSGVMTQELLQTIWVTLSSSKPLMDKRDELREIMIKWAGQKGYQINDDFFFDKVFFTDLMAGDLDRGEARPTEKNINRGMNPQWTLDVELGYAQQKAEEEKAEDETEGTRTFEEKLRLVYVTPRQPPSTLLDLTVNTATFTALVFALFGPGCAVYIRSWWQCVKRYTVSRLSRASHCYHH